MTPRKSRAMNRRGFLRISAGTGAAVVTGSRLNAAVLDPMESQQRLNSAVQVRIEAASSYLRGPRFQQVTTGDEERYDDKRASFSKTLPHNELGEVLPEAYHSFVDILVHGDSNRFAEMPRAEHAQLRLNNPQGG